ncbi:MAG: arylamine N-acetyltransferase [Bacteroidota bacterium]
MNIKNYTNRIGYKDNIEITESCLRELHKCHVMSIPFEAIDVYMGRRIELDLESIYHKVINKQRGGYCYELNYLFHKMLSEVGFPNFMISASIFNEDQFGPEFDHMAIIVELEDQWLVDVGFGDLFIEPIKIETQHKQHDKLKIYEIKKICPNEYILYEYLTIEAKPAVKYNFGIEPREISEFTEQNNWKQTSDESFFVKNRICTLPMEKGRKTIFNDFYKTKSNGESKEIKIEGNLMFIKLLKDEFQIDIENTP